MSSKSGLKSKGQTLSCIKYEAINCWIFTMIQCGQDILRLARVRMRRISVGMLSFQVRI